MEYLIIYQAIDRYVLMIYCDPLLKGIIVVFQIARASRLQVRGRDRSVSVSNNGKFLYNGHAPCCRPKTDCCLGYDE